MTIPLLGLGGSCSTPSLSSFCSISADWVYTTMYLRAFRKMDMAERWN